MSSRSDPKVHSVTSDLQSTKITDRTKGLKRCRELIAEGRISVDAESSSSLIGAILQSIEADVAKIRESKTQDLKSPERIKSAANCLRDIVGKSARILSPKHFPKWHTRIRLVLTRLSDAPVLDLMKAYRFFLECEPIIQGKYLTEKVWVELAEMCFNVVLSDDMKRKFADDVQGDESEVQSSDAAMESEDSSLSLSSSPSKKRKRIHSRPHRMHKLKPVKVCRKELPTGAQNEAMVVLSILLHSPHAPLSVNQVTGDDDRYAVSYAHVPSSVLTRFGRALECYAVDASLYYDMLTAILSTLDHVALNRPTEVTRFSFENWALLVQAWRTKKTNIGESLISVLRTLFPYLTHQDPKDVSFPWIDDISTLLKTLDFEVVNRGSEGLFLECLRLETVDCGAFRPLGAFTSWTLRSGHNFDAAQALSWAVLEFQADCVQKIYEHSETYMNPGTKRSRQENALLLLLDPGLQPNVRAHQLQVLLFFIERHWSVVHVDNRKEVFGRLLRTRASDPPLIQSWTLLCLTAIAHADMRAPNPDTRTYQPDWDRVWSHALRGVRTAAISRAACHAAFVLNSAPSLVSARHLADGIQTLAKELEIQGPPFPYDSVCAFLSQSIQFARQDARIHRMHLEDKVLTWLIQSWPKPRGVILPQSLLQDAQLLLQTICGMRERTHVSCRPLLPDCVIVRALISLEKTRVVREYILDAVLPAAPCERTVRPSRAIDGEDLAEETPREQRLSRFLIDRLGDLMWDWESASAPRTHLNAGSARYALDFAVIALCFEAALGLNGTRPNRPVIQAACKLSTTVTSLLATDSKYPLADVAQIMLSLEPLLTTTGRDEDANALPLAMLTPTVGSGIKTEILERLGLNHDSVKQQAAARKQELIRQLALSTDVQDAFGTIAGTLRTVLEQILKGSGAASEPMDPENFFPDTSIRADKHLTPAVRIVQELCIGFLAMNGGLLLPANDPVFDKQLTEVVLLHGQKDLDDIHLEAMRTFLCYVRNRDLDLYPRFMETAQYISGLSKSRTIKCREAFHLLLIQFIEATLPIWTRKAVVPKAAVDILNFIAHEDDLFLSWRARDAQIQFCARYLAADPSSTIWKTYVDHPEDDENDSDDGDDPEAWNPIGMLRTGTDDHDVRVRFRAALLVPDLFAVSRAGSEPIAGLYSAIGRMLPRLGSSREKILTRLLTEGNIAIVDSATRRSGYYHILEPSFVDPSLSRHTERILRCVAQRLGFPSFRGLFDAYVSQIVFSIRLLCPANLLKLPVQLLGYEHRTIYTAHFRTFGYMILAMDSQTGDGSNQFRALCTHVGKDPAVGIQECFADVTGFCILSFLKGTVSEDMSAQAAAAASGAPMPEAPSVAGDALRELLLRWTSGPPNFDELLENTVDGTLAFILHSLGDHDPAIIRRALQREEPVSTYSTVFSALVKYQEQAAEIYSDRNPSFPASGLLLAMQSLSQLVNERDRKATVYHVTQQLFADILRSPLLDQQFRLLNALCLWIAVRWPDFHDSALLHRLVCGSASLLAQRDLSRRAQSILEWAFKQYPQVEQGHRRLPDILLRVSSIVDDFTRQPASQELGASLRTWVDEQVSELYDVAELTEHVVRALSAWPWSHDRHDASTLATLSDILGDSSIVSNRFRLVRRLQALSSQAVDPDAHAQFADIDFWRLKESILPRDQLQIQDVEAFATLLETHEGRISSFPKEQSRFHGKRRDGTSKAIDWIVTELLLMLEASDISTVHVAYRTLRLVMSVDPAHALELAPDHHREIELIKTYRCVPLVRTPRSLEELHDPESALVGAESDFPHWVRLVATLLSDILSVHEPFYAQLTLILEADSAFTAKLLPVLVHAVLQIDPASREPLSFFFRNVLQSAAASLDCTRCIVDIVLYLRQFGQNLGKRDLSHDKWLAIDYMLLAEKAIQCGAYTTALLFIELAHEYSPQIQESTEEELLYEIYSHIDEPDGFYAVKSRDTSRLLVKRFHHEHQWDKAFHFHGASFTSGVPDETAASGMVNSFHAFGFDGLAMDALYKYSPSSELTPLTYRLGWRTESWDLPDSTASGGGGSLYRALRAVFAGRNKDVIKTTIQASFLEEIERLRVLGSENLTGIRDAAQNLMCIQQVSRYTMTDIADRSSQWVSFATLGSGFEFPDFENLMATRLALVRADKRREETRNGTSPILRSLLDAEKRCLIRLSEAAREAQQSQIALNSIETARRDDSVPEPIEVSVEYAHVLHMQNEQQLAVKLLTDLNLAESQLDDADKAVNFACLGTWLSAARLGDPTNIAEYFDSAALYVKQSPDPESRVKHAFVCEKYATFAAQQYKTIRSSSDGIRWQVYVDRKREQLKHLAKQGQLNLVPSTERLYQIDLAHLNKHADALQMFLAQAIEMYSRALEISDDFDGDAPIRLCSLWFQNFNSTSDAFQQVIQSALKRVPSRKLVFLAHQLSARIDKSSDPTQKTLQSTVLKMCIEHPFHSFYQVWSLLPATEQAGSLSENRRQSGRSAAATEFTSRSEASSELFARLKQDKQCRKRVLDMALLASASQQWALHKLDKNHVSGKYRPIPASIKLQSIANLNVPVLTNPPAVDPSLRYTSFVAVGKFDTQYTTAGGVNLPKIYICLGSDGATYKQLFKGSGTQDDLRQDAVMEQVFTLVNTVLAGNRETKRRSLLVRGYRIVPLGAMAGVLEFVSDTIPYLSLVKNLYRDYTPSGSWTLAKATAEVFRWKTEKIGAQARVPLMEQLLRNFRPVLRHYFTEQHKNPLAWFEMRLAYTRSVATTSIVGHILGLGDRHGSNILVSKTGEVVHIDLGIAFDQGTFLPVPELVPFRLTANMVDGMGVSGTDGVFQRCCEETLRVLRDRSEVIMTVLEVFKHDPLHSWTMSDYKKNKAQQPPDEGTLKSTVALQGLGIDIDMSSGNAAESADRALAGVTRKLDKSLAVGSMVNSLIAQATDPARLASIYYGWGPQN